MKGSEKIRTKILFAAPYRTGVFRMHRNYVIGLYRMVYLDNKKHPLIEFYCKEFGLSYHKPEKFYRLVFVHYQVKGYEDNVYFDMWVSYTFACQRPIIEKTFYQTYDIFDRANKKLVDGFIFMTDTDKERISLLLKQIGMQEIIKYKS